MKRTTLAVCALLWAGPAMAAPMPFPLAALLKGPAVLVLRPGVYAPVTIAGLSGHTTITSFDPEYPAVLTGLKITGSKGLTFTALEFAFAPALSEVATTGYGVKVLNSSDIHFSQDDIHGAVDKNPANDIGGLSFANCSVCSVDRSELHDLKNGGVFAGSQAATLSNNLIHDIRADGWDVVTSSGVLIAGNYVRDFHHLGQVGVSTRPDHSDAFQFFTANQTASSKNITITGNLISQGAGAPMQGIFLQDEAKTLPYCDVSITGNTVVGGNPNSIVVNHSCGTLNISGNTAAAMKGVLNSKGQQATVGIGGPPGVAIGPNVRSMVSDGGAALIARWKAQH